MILGEIQGYSWQNFMLIRNTYPNHSHSGDFLCLFLDELLMSLRMYFQVMEEDYSINFILLIFYPCFLLMYLLSCGEEIHCHDTCTVFIRL